MPDVEAVERATTESLLRSARLIGRLNEVLADRRRRLDDADRSIARAHQVARSLEIDLRDRGAEPSPHDRATTS